MIEDIFFQVEGQVKITAASVGISRLRWIAVKEDGIGVNEYSTIMETYRLDHLPIESVTGTVFEFFKTAEPDNFSKVERCQIKHEDTIPLETNIRDVIDKFADQNRSFFFLRHNRNISGLITLGNLNCKQVQVYIFSLICELERELGFFLNSKLNAEEIKKWVSSKAGNNNVSNKYKSMLESYEKLRTSDLENQLTEHFFFIDFLEIIKDYKLFKELRYSRGEWKNLSGINQLRNLIAHPTRSLLDNENTIFKLRERICKIEDLTFRMIMNSQTRNSYVPPSELP